MTVTDAVGGTVSRAAAGHGRPAPGDREGRPASRARASTLAGARGRDRRAVVVRGEGAVDACDLGSRPGAGHDGHLLPRRHLPGPLRHRQRGDVRCLRRHLDQRRTPADRAGEADDGREGRRALYVPVARVGTGDQVRFDVRANDPSTHGTKGDPLTCRYDHGNGLRESQAAYEADGSCNGQTSYLAPGRHTSRVRVIDDDGAVGKARASVVVVRRDVHLAVRDVKRGGTRRRHRRLAHAARSQRPGGPAFPNGQSLVATQAHLDPGHQLRLGQPARPRQGQRQARLPVRGVPGQQVPAGASRSRPTPGRSGSRESTSSTRRSTATSSASGCTRRRSTLAATFAQMIWRRSVEPDGAFSTYATRAVVVPRRTR